MAIGTRVRKGWSTFLAHTLNPVALRSARGKHGPFSLIRHVGRKSGRSYETPIIVAPIAGGFVAELTYGRQVAWYRNLAAAGHGVLVVHGEEHAVDAVSDLDADIGLAAYGQPWSSILRVLHRRDFLLLHVAER